MWVDEAGGAVVYSQFSSEVVTVTKMLRNAKYTGVPASLFEVPQCYTVPRWRSLTSLRIFLAAPARPQTARPLTMRGRVGHTIRRYIVSTAALCLVGCGAAGPTAPSPNPPPGGGLRVACPSSLLVGETGACAASSGETNVSQVAAWSSAPSEIAGVDQFARVTGKAAGAATVSASYGGRTATASVSVRAEDGLVVALGTTQGSGRVGETVAIGFSGWYSVVSAELGNVTVTMGSADGRVLSSSVRAVARGGGPFALTASTPMAAGAGRICGTATLRISSTDLPATGPLSAPLCIDEVRP